MPGRDFPSTELWAALPDTLLGQFRSARIAARRARSAAEGRRQQAARIQESSATRRDAGPCVRDDPLAAAYRHQGADVGAVRLEDDIVAAFGPNGVASVAVMLDRAAERRAHRVSAAEPRVVGAVPLLPRPPAPDAVEDAAGINRRAIRLELRLGQFVARHAEAHHLPRDLPLEQLARH